MKNIIKSLIIAIFIAFSFVSCTKEDINQVPNHPTHIVIPTPEDPEPYTPPYNTYPEWLSPNSDYSYTGQLYYLENNLLRIIETSPRYNYGESTIYATVYEYLDTDTIVIRLKGRVESDYTSSDIVYLCYNDFDKLIEDFEKIKYVEENYNLKKYSIKLSPKVSKYQNTEPTNIFWNIIPINQGISIDFNSPINYNIPGDGSHKYLKIKYADYIDLIEWLITLKNKL